MHLVMFDIDGTLVDSAGFDSALFVEAVQHVLKVEIDRDRNTYEHVSDSGIFEEVVRRARLGEIGHGSSPRWAISSSHRTAVVPSSVASAR